MKKTADEEKAVIFYVREYRHFRASVSDTVLFILLFVLPTAALFALFYSPLTRGICLWAGSIVSQLTGEAVDIMSQSFLPGRGGVFYLSLEGSLPTFTHAVITGIATLAAVIVVGQIGPNSRPFMIYLCMGLYILLISCVFFILWPERFPYTLTDYSELYMLQMTALIIILPAIFGIALSLIKVSFFERVLAMAVQIAVQLLYNIIRYVLYLVFLRYCSSLYMASLYFSFGMLFDFIQMVAIYAYFAKKASEYFNSLEGKSKWAWS